MRGESDNLWKKVKMLYVKLDGIEDGWRNGVKRRRMEIEIKKNDLILMKMVSDINELENKFKR